VACLHAVLCWPQVAAIYDPTQVWRLRGFPVRAALGLESERDYLRRNLWEYEVADMVQATAKPGEKTLALLDAPRAYIDRDLVEWWQSAEGERLADTLKVASVYADIPLYDLRGEWPIQTLTGLRWRLRVAHPGEWAVSDVELYSGGDRIFNSPQWTLRSWPNRWETPLAFDGNLASRWRTWGPMRAGMIVEAIFDRPQRVSRAVMTSHTPNYGVPVELYGRGIDWKWRLLSSELPAQLRPREDLRRTAIRHLKRSGIHYILAPTEYVGDWRLGAALAGHEDEWGLTRANVRGFVYMLKVP
jgi:hypothetical protein